MKYEIVDGSEIKEGKVTESLSKGIFPVTSQLTSYALFSEQVYSSAERVEELARSPSKNAQALVAEFSKQYGLFTGILNRIKGAKTREGEFPRHYITLFELLEDRLNNSIINYHEKIGVAA